MSMNIDWNGLLWEARGFLGLEDDDPVPIDELVAQASANGWDKREAREGLRETDELLPAGDTLEDGVIQAAEADPTPADDPEPDDAPEDDETGGDGGDRDAEAHEAFADAIRFYHNQLDRDIAVEYAETPRDYFETVRGWTPETVDEKLLGYAPADCKDELIAYLFDRGHDRETILGSGLFYENGLKPHFNGRFVLPYFDEDGEPVYAISRSIAEDDGGHPGDHHGDQKYTKAVKAKDYSALDEPIYGLSSVDDDTDRLLVAGGVADAITLHEAGYACISPVTTVRFKGKHEPRVLDLIDEYGIETVYMMNDAERPTVDAVELEDGETADRITDVLTIQQWGEGLRGAFGNAEFLLEADVETRLVDLPGGDDDLRKVDPDDVITDNWATVETLLRSAAPATEHRGYATWRDNRQSREIAKAATTDSSTALTGADGDKSALFNLNFHDVTGLSAGFRGNNPLGHHGDSENYFTVVEKHGSIFGFDHKYGVAYNALTYLACEAGKRTASNPNGEFGGRELLETWLHAKRQGHIPDDDPIPSAALVDVALDADLCDREDVEGGWKLPAGVYGEAIDVVEDTYGVDAGRSGFDGSRDDAEGARPSPEECAPPVVDAEPFDRKQQWADLQGDRYQEWLDDGRPTRIWADDAGSGKTTNAALGAASRERSHTVLSDKHEKARESITDEVTPDGYFHLKGGEQPAHDCCMDAVVRADEGERPTCPTHGDPGEWPRKNPIYERDPGDDLRKRYEALLPAKGELGALRLLDEDGELLEDNPWIEQFDGLENRERVAGVHEYQQLKTAVGDRDLILDETPRLLSDTQRVTVAELTSVALRLEDLAGLRSTDEHKRENFRALAAFATDVRDAIAGDGTATLEDVDPPRVLWDSYESWDDVAGGYMELVEPEEPWHVAEALAQVKLTYNETLVSRIREGDWNGEPFCIDALLAAAAEAGLDDETVRKAIAVPATLDRCPWCGDELANDNGARVCTSDGCGWHEAKHTVIRKDADPARAIAWLEDPNGPDRAEGAGLVSRILPPASDLPNPLVLDATATPSKVAAFYGEDDVDVRGDAPLDLEGKLRVTQVLDGQYHAQTIKDTPSLQERIQSAIDTAGEVHDRPLFGIRGDLISLFEFPENGEVLKYHAARGLNRAECDAVVCIGAPHPDIEDLKRSAKLLAQDRDDVRVGGDEHSTRRDAPNPPVYRKLRYQDDDGNGLAIPTKHYTGLVGDLFREARENELVQFVHRIRPLLVDDVEPAKDAYLLTNVPTDLPVDDVVEFDELAGDLSAVFPVTEGAIRLLEYAHDALEGDAPDGFRPGTLVEQREDRTIANKVAGWHRLATMHGEDVTRRTVRNWVDDLEAVGLLSPETYEQRRGVSYAADPATSKRALQVLSGNVGFEVAALRRFSEKVGGADGSLGWLEWARDALALSGDRCEWGPPPDSAG